MANERLTFTTGNRSHFDVSLDDLQSITFPWFYFGGGMHLSVAGRHYRLSFVRPTSEQGNVFDVPEGRAATQGWRQVLARR